MQEGAKNPQYRAKAIATYARHRAAFVAELKASFSNPADALLFMAWYYGGRQNLLKDLKGNNTFIAAQIAFRDMLSKQGAWNADQAYNAMVQQAKSLNSKSKKPFGSGSQDKAYFVKCFNVSKGIFTKLKSLIGNPTAFWQEASKAADALTFDIYDDTKHPLYVNINDPNLSSSVGGLGKLAGAIAALGSIKPTQPVVAFAQGNKSPGASAPANVQGAQQPKSGQAQKPMDGEVEEPSGKSEGLSTGAMIGIGVAGLVVVGGAVAFAMRGKGKSAKVRRRS